MAIATDYNVDIMAHRSFGKPLALNLCSAVATCVRPHSEPVELNGVSERRIAGDGSGRPVCIICKEHCGLDHVFFKSFCGLVAEACLSGGDYASDRRTTAFRVRNIKLWHLLCQYGCQQVFLPTPAQPPVKLVEYEVQPDY
jgi:hypothetical protein